MQFLIFYDKVSTIHLKGNCYGPFCDRQFETQRQTYAFAALTVNSARLQESTSCFRAVLFEGHRSRTVMDLAFADSFAVLFLYFQVKKERKWRK